MKTAILLACLLLSASLQAAEKVIRVATDGTFPPYSMVNSDGTLSGFDVDITHALCAEMKVRCDIRQYDFDSIIAALRAHKFDMVVASMAITDERKKAVAFSDKYEGGYSRFMGRAGTALSGDPASMKGRRIGVQTGSIQENYARDIYGKADAKVISYGTPELAWLDLLAGRLDAVVVEVGVGSELKKRKGAEGFDFFGPRMDDPIYFGVGSGIAVRHEDKVLLTSINKALKTILANGTYKAINDNYFDYNQYD